MRAQPWVGLAGWFGQGARVQSGIECRCGRGQGQGTSAARVACGHSKGSVRCGRVAAVATRGGSNGGAMSTAATATTTIRDVARGVAAVVAATAAAAMTVGHLPQPSLSSHTRRS